jgi:hypothetical protein
MTINWRVNNLKRSTELNGLENVVTSIEWEASIQEVVEPHTHTKFKRGTVELAAPEVSSFTTYASITEVNAINWLKAALGDQVETIEDELDSLINESKTSKIKLGIPWGPTVT